MLKKTQREVDCNLSKMAVDDCCLSLRINYFKMNTLDHEICLFENSFVQGYTFKCSNQQLFEHSFLKQLFSKSHYLHFP